MKPRSFPRIPASPTIAPVLCGALLLLGWGPAASAALKSASKWDVFEQEFRSTQLYGNPAQEARLTIQFISPTGRTNRVYGYWDGGSIWGVRFRPDELGRWTYTTECSDTRNRGLHNRSGGFVCTVKSLRLNLYRHGPIKVSPGAARFQYADGTPFFWQADGVWDGARKSTEREWREYALRRSTQGFNVALWSAAPGVDERNRTAFEGTEAIRLNIRFFKGLDDKLRMLNQREIVGAIAPLWDVGIADEDLLPEQEVIVLLRQMVARWDAYPVVWVIGLEADAGGRHAARWRRIGRSVFDQVTHSPVILFCGSSPWALKDFAKESWVDAVAFQSGNDVSEGASLWLAKGPASNLWKEQPIRPVLNLLPATEAGFNPEGQPITSAQAIKSIARSLFVAPPAGMCYQSQSIAHWDTTEDTNTVAATGKTMAEWQKSLYLPGAKRVGAIRELLEANQFDELYPSDSILLPPPQEVENLVPLSALASPGRDRALIYVPEGGIARLAPNALREPLTASFFSLETGDTQSATAGEGRGINTFTAPGSGDWLLVLAQKSE